MDGNTRHGRSLGAKLITAQLIAGAAVMLLEAVCRFTKYLMPMTLSLLICFLIYTAICIALCFVDGVKRLYVGIKSNPEGADITRSFLRFCAVSVLAVAVSFLCIMFFPDFASAGELSLPDGEYAAALTAFFTALRDKGYMSPLFTVSVVASACVGILGSASVCFCAAAGAKWREHPFVGFLFGVFVFDLLNSFVNSLLYSICARVSPGLVTVSSAVSSFLSVDTTSPVKSLTQMTELMPVATEYCKLTALSSLLTIVSTVTCLIAASFFLGAKRMTDR